MLEDCREAGSSDSLNQSCDVGLAQVFRKQSLEPRCLDAGAFPGTYLDCLRRIISRIPGLRRLVGLIRGDFSSSDLDRARFGSTSGFRQFGTCQNVIGQFGRDASRSLPFPHKAASRSLANFAGKVMPIDSYIFTASPSRARALVASPAPLRSSSIAANHSRAVGCRCFVGRGIHLLDGSEVMVLGRRPVSRAGRCDAGYSATCHVTAHDPGAREQQLFGERPQRSRIFLPSHRRQTKGRILQRNPCPHRVQLPRNRKLPAPVCPGAGCAVSLALGKNCEAERIKGSGNKGLPFHSGWIRTLAFRLGQISSKEREVG